MAWTTPKTWSAGETLTAANFNVHIRDNLNALPDHILARKTADEQVVSSTTPQADDHLLFAIGANQVWFLRLILWSVENGGNLLLSCTMPASGTASLMGMGFNTGGSPDNLQFSHSTSRTMFVTPSAGWVSEWLGYATTGGTAGNWQLTWAQATSNGGATILKKGSFLSGYQIT